jgi:hypothetical protein
MHNEKTMSLFFISETVERDSGQWEGGVYTYKQLSGELNFGSYRTSVTAVSHETEKDYLRTVSSYRRTGTLALWI